MEAFVYYWVDQKKDMYYIGSHKGSQDGYDCSCKKLQEELDSRREDFTRYIWDEGSYEEMYALETDLLTILDARNDPLSYNGHNNSGEFRNKGHSEETKRKIAGKLKGCKIPPDVIERRSKTVTGRKRPRQSILMKAKYQNGLVTTKGKTWNLTEEQKQNLRHPKTLEHAQNISKGKKGKPNGQLGVKRGPYKKSL